MAKFDCDFQYHTKHRDAARHAQLAIRDYIAANIRLLTSDNLDGLTGKIQREERDELYHDTALAEIEKKRLEQEAAEADALEAEIEAVIEEVDRTA